MSKTVFLPLTLAALTGACVTVVPLEDRPRALNLTWALEPETTDRMEETVDQGDIVMSWTGSVAATHEIGSDSGRLPLAAVSTSYGTLYCAFNVPAESRACYEDRDADGGLDYRWTVNANGRAPLQLTTASEPEALPAPRPVSVIEADAPVVLTQQLGLLYNGPVEGTVDQDDLSFKVMIGEFVLGWHGGRDAPRDPSGLGWVDAKLVPMVMLEGATAETLIKPLAFTYQVLDATVEGLLTLRYSAKPVKALRLTDKFEYDVEKSNTPGPGELTPEDIAHTDGHERLYNGQTISIPVRITPQPM